MRVFDQAFIDDTIRRIRSIPGDRKPLWGLMTPPQMIAHITTAIRYGLGKEPETPAEGGFFGKYIARPLILGGFIKMPKNVKKPKMYDTTPPEGDPETLQAECDEFLARMTAGDFTPPTHPYFGDIGLRGWAKLHVVHVEHHLRQFDA